MTSDRKDYEVGYGKPPSEHRFRKGKSGNPRGRPRTKQVTLAKHSFNPFIEVFAEEMVRTISVKEGGKTIEMEAFRAVVRSLTVSAVKGRSSAQRFLMEMQRSVQQERLKEMAEMLRSTESYKAEWPALAAQAARQGSPVPLPRPEHIGVSLERGVMEITGPTDQSQDAAWQSAKFALRCAEAHLKEAEEYAAKDAGDPSTKERSAKCKRRLRKLESLVQPGWDWRECVTEEDRQHYAELGDLLVPSTRK